MAAKVFRKVGDKEQRIVVTGDTDWLTNGERLTRRSKINSEFSHLQDYSLYWMTYNSYPIDVDRPGSLDYRFHIKTTSLPAMKITFWFGLPVLMIISCIVIQFKRKRK